MRKKPSADNTLHDHIKELYEEWMSETDEFLVPVQHFTTDFLRGYLCCYYKGDTTHIEEALQFIQDKFQEWDMEHEETFSDENEEESVRDRFHY